MDLLGDQLGLDAFDVLVGHGAAADLGDRVLALLFEDPVAALDFPGTVEGRLREERFRAVRGHAEAATPDFILSFVLFFTLAWNQPALGIQTGLERVLGANLPGFGT